MADKGGARRPAGQDLEASSPDRIRNVVLVGPGGSGKTTLVETLLAAAGAIPRAGSVRDGTTVTDFDESEQAHERSSSLALAPLVHDGIKINLVDTPGYADFVGELRAGLRAADCALFVIAANEGVDDGTRSLWRECADVGMPRAVIITKLDQARADYDGVLAQAQVGLRRQGDAALPPGPRGLRGRLPDGPACAQRPRASGAADRGNHRGVGGRDPHGPLPRRRGDRREGPHRRPRACGRARDVLPRRPCLLGHRRRLCGAAEPRHPRLPVPVGASSALGVHPGRRLERTDHLRPRRAGSWPRWSRRRATPTSDGSAWSGSSPARCGPTTPYTSRGTSPPSSAKGRVTRTTTRTSGSAASPTPSARTRSRPARSWRATSAPSAGSPGPRPATPSRRSTIRGC